jgi:hypothetical protein
VNRIASILVALLASIAEPATSYAHHHVIVARAGVEMAGTAAGTLFAGALAGPAFPLVWAAGYARGAQIGATAVGRMIREPHHSLGDLARATRWELNDWSKGNSLVHR